MMNCRMLALVCGISIGTIALAGVPVNSFLLVTQNTTKGLVKHVRDNPVVMDRYVRHFQMTPAEIMRMFGGLHTERLAADTYFEVWNVPSATGELRSKRNLLKRGVPIWVNQAGIAVLKVSCGNPLTRMDEASDPFLNQDVGNPSETVPMSSPQTFLAEPEPMINMVEPVAPTMTEPVFVETPGIAPIESAPARFNIPGIGFLPTVLIGFTGGGGGGGDTPVPEPASIIALGTGLMLVVSRIKRRSR